MTFNLSPFIFSFKNNKRCINCTARDKCLNYIIENDISFMNRTIVQNVTLKLHRISQMKRILSNDRERWHTEGKGLIFFFPQSQIPVYRLQLIVTQPIDV